MEVQNRGDFGAFIPAELDEYPLDPFEFRIYARISRRAGNQGCFESLPRMAKGCGMSLSRARRAVHFLDKAGFIHLEDRSSKGLPHLCWINAPIAWADPKSLEGIRKSLTPSKNDTPIKSDSPPLSNLVAPPIKSDSPPLSKVIYEGTPIKGIQIKSSHKETRAREKFRQQEVSPKSFDLLPEKTKTLNEMQDPVLDQNSAAEIAISFKDFVHPAQRCDDRFNRKLFPWRLSEKRNDYDLGFLEYLRTVHLPKTSNYKGKVVTTGDSKNWIISREYDDQKVAAAYARWDDYQDELKKADRRTTTDANPCPDRIESILCKTFSLMTRQDHEVLIGLFVSLGEEKFYQRHRFLKAYLRDMKRNLKELFEELTSHVSASA